MILPKDRDRRFVTIRRGGTLTDSDHQLLALWAASCAEHVLELFESAQPEDPRPRQAIQQIRAWVRGEITMTQARTAGGHAMAAARDLRGAARDAAYAAGQAAVVAHVAAHELGAAAYAIKATRAAAPEGEWESAGRIECRWQRDQLPDAIRELVLDDQRLRNDICWSAFDCLTSPAEVRRLVECRRDADRGAGRSRGSVHVAARAAAASAASAAEGLPRSTPSSSARARRSVAW